MQNRIKQSDVANNEQGKMTGTVRQIPLLLVMVAFLSVTLLGLATAAIAAGSVPAATAGPGLSPPMQLPGNAGASSAGGYGSGAGRWIIGAVPGASSHRIATQAGARAVKRSAGIYSISRAGAPSLADSLRDKSLLAYAEPDSPVLPSSYPPDKFSSAQWWLDRIVDTAAITPPPVSPNSPRLGLVEESLDPLHPDLLQANLSGPFSIGPLEDSHGTAVAAIAGSPGEGLGIRGVWPGMNMTHFPSGDSCSTATKAVFAAARARVAAINMSYGFPSDVCFSHYVATEAAVRKGVLPVAAAGNTHKDLGNVAMRPATDPHVISVSAVDEADMVADFATRNRKVDITAPGDGVNSPFVSVQGAGTGDEVIQRLWALNRGTSFSTPMVAAAATWLAQARPELDARQIGRLLTSSATDLGVPGRDPLYGEGLLDIGSALAAKTPPDDPKEPNDDIAWVDGSLLPGKAGFVWKPGRKKAGKVIATLSRAKDPADVYRVRIAPRGKVLVTAAQYQGDVKLKVYRPKVESIRKPAGQLIVKSDKARPGTEGVLVRNLKRKPQLVYVALTPSPRWTGQYSRYKLKVNGR